MPMITFSGVRNSWLMPLRNSGIEWSCVSASRGIGGEKLVVGFTMSLLKNALETSLEALT